MSGAAPADHLTEPLAGHRPPPLGPVPWTVGGSRAFVLPSASGANRRSSDDVRPTRLEWWSELAALLR